MDYDVLVERVEARPVMTVRATRPPAELGPALGEILPHVRRVMVRQGSEPLEPPMTKYHTVEAEAVDFEAGFAAPHAMRDEDDVQAGEWPETLAAVVTHEGVYESVHRAHSAIGAWLAEGGYVAAGPPWEEYVVGPQDTDDPHDWRTRVCWPVTEE